MTSEERVQKFHTDDVSLLRSGSASDWLKQIFENFPVTRPIRGITQICVVKPSVW